MRFSMLGARVNRRCRPAHVLVVGAFTVALVGNAARVSAADWPQLQGNPARTGRTADSVAPPYRMKWAWMGPGKTQTTLPLSGGAWITIAGRAHPVIAAGRVFIGTLDGSAHGISAST